MEAKTVRRKFTADFYYQPSQESKTNLDILSFLDKQYLKTPFYGVERLHALLAQQGMGINRKRLLVPQRQHFISIGL